MKIQFENPGDFKNFIALIEPFVQECNIRINQFGFRMQTKDMAKTMMFDFMVDKPRFKVFEAEDETYGVAIKDLKSILSKLKPKDELIVEEVDSQLIFIIEGKATRRYNLAIIDDIKYQIENPSLSFEVIFKCDSAEFSEICNDAAELTIKDNSSVQISAENNLILQSDSGRVRGVEIKYDDIDVVKEGKAMVRVAGAYLSKIVDAKKIAPEVKVSIADNYPLKLTYDDKSKLVIIVAPRVEND